MPVSRTSRDGSHHIWAGSLEASETFYPSPGGDATCAEIAMTPAGTVVGVGTFSDTNDVHVMSDPKTGSGWRTTLGLPTSQVGRSVVVTSGGIYAAGETGDQIGLWKLQP